MCLNAINAKMEKNCFISVKSFHAKTHANIDIKVETSKIKPKKYLKLYSITIYSNSRHFQWQAHQKYKIDLQITEKIIFSKYNKINAIHVRLKNFDCLCKELSTFIRVSTTAATISYLPYITFHYATVS